MKRLTLTIRHGDTNRSESAVSHTITGALALIRKTSLGIGYAIDTASDHYPKFSEELETTGKAAFGWGDYEWVDAPESAVAVAAVDPDIAKLRADVERLRQFAKSAERVFSAWATDADPDGSLNPGESADKDAAEIMLQSAREALAATKRNH